MLDLRHPDHAYLFGFLLGDGSLYRGRGRKGRLTLELAERDGDHLLALADLLPGGRISSRVRRTNFSDESRTVVLAWCREEVRAAVAAAGMPSGRKDHLVAPPAAPHSARDVARGFFDADGSLGFTAQGAPFLSLVTNSQHMAHWWVALLLEHAGAVRTCRPNLRDGVANVMVQREPAVAMAAWLYAPGDLALPRKHHLAGRMVHWSRPAGMRAASRPRGWTAEQDARAVGPGAVTQIAAELERSVSSVVTRRWRLRHAR